MTQNKLILRELQRRAAAMISSGTMSNREVAVALGVKPTVISYWMGKEDFKQLVLELAKDRTEELTEALRDAATTAAARLRAHITATNKMGQPLWDVQIAAIKLALAYELGEPVTKTEAKELKLSGNVSKEVMQALADPTIRHKLLGTTVPLPLENPPDTPSPEPGSPEGPGEPEEVLDPVRERPGELLPGDTGSQPLEQAVTSPQSHQGP